MPHPLNGGPHQHTCRFAIFFLIKNIYKPSQSFSMDWRMGHGWALPDPRGPGSPAMCIFPISLTDQRAGSFGPMEN
jgi:hypothetical protein